MPKPTKCRLYSQDASVVVRTGRSVADAAGWSPDNLSAPETADGVTLDAREWDSIRLAIDWTTAGVKSAGGSVVAEILISVPDPLGTRGRTWRLIDTVSGLTDATVTDPIETHGHDVAVRLTTITLSGADVVNVRATGGAWAGERAR